MANKKLVKVIKLEDLIKLINKIDPNSPYLLKIKLEAFIYERKIPIYLVEKLTDIVL